MTKKKQKPSEVLDKPARKEDETYDDYLNRRERENQSVKDWLKGRPAKKGN